MFVFTSCSKRSQYVSVFVCLLLVFCHAPAWGHAGATVESIDVVRPLVGGQLGVETSVGYLRTSNSLRYDWFCHEVVTQSDAVITPRYTANSAGVTLASVGDLKQARDSDHALYWSTDGCDWSVSDGLVGQSVSDVELSPHDPSLGILLTKNDSGPNGIYITNDAGQTWQSTGVLEDDRVFRSVRFSRGSSGTIWVAAFSHETEQTWAYRSIDDGLSWTEHEISVPEGSDPFTYLEVLAVDAENPDIAWMVMGPYLDDRLLQTTDGGETFTEVYAVEKDIIDGAQDSKGGLWLILSGNSIVYAPPGEAFEVVDTAPMSLGVEADSSQVFLASRVMAEGGPLATSTDGISFEISDVFAMLEPLTDCAAESDYEVYCAPLWESLEEVITKAPRDTAEPPDTGREASAEVEQSGCCRSDAKQSSVGFMFVIMLALGRRKQRA